MTTVLIAGVPMALGVAVSGFGRLRRDAGKKPGRSGPPPLLGVRRRGEHQEAEKPSTARESAQAATQVAAAIVSETLAGTVDDVSATDAEQRAIPSESATPVQDAHAAEREIVEDVNRVVEQAKAPVMDVVVVVPQNAPAEMPLAERVLLPPRDGNLRSATTVKEVRRRVTLDGREVTDPLVLDKDGMLGVLETEELPPVDAWEQTRGEREAAFLAARAAAIAEEARLREEDERRDIEARATALAEAERQKKAEQGWWVQLDPEAATEAERMALVSSLVGVKMEWARRVLSRAMREDESKRVRARAIGAMARAGFLDDPTPFDEIMKENDRILNVALREALTPHQDRLWVRNLFA